MSEYQKHTKPNVPNLSDKRETNVGRNIPNLRFPGFSGEWEKLTLGEISEYRKERIATSDLASEIYVSTENMLPDYGGIAPASNIPESNNVSAFYPGDILISNIRPYLKKVWQAQQHGGCSSDVLVVKPEKKVFDRFLYFYLANDSFVNYAMVGAKGVKMPRGDKEQIMKYELALPSISEQKKIASLLLLIDQRIAIQNKVIEQYESLIKALRCHIFSTIESEKEVTIADVLSYEQPTKYIVSDTEYSDNKDLTPVLTANKAFVLGYTEETKGVYDKGPCIILDDFTLDSKIVDFPFKVKSSAIKILSAKTSVHLRYIYEYLKFLDLNTEEHKRHYISEIEPMTIELPDEDAIQSIAYLFDRMDQRRQGLERGLQLLKYQKDYLMRTLFI